MEEENLDTSTTTESKTLDQTIPNTITSSITENAGDHAETVKEENKDSTIEEQAEKEGSEESNPAEEKENGKHKKAKRKISTKHNLRGRKKASLTSTMVKKPERDISTTLSKMLSGELPLTYPLKINSWLEVTNLGEISPDKSKAIVRPRTNPKSRGKKQQLHPPPPPPPLLWPVGFEVRRRTVSYVYPGKSAIYKCSVQVSSTGSEMPEYVISTDEDPGNAIVRNDPEESLKELRRRVQNVSPGVNKNMNYSDADSFFGVSNEVVQSFIKKLPNYDNVFPQKSIDEVGYDDKIDVEEMVVKESKRRKVQYFDYDFIGAVEDFYAGEEDDDNDDTYVPGNKNRPKGVRHLVHMTRSQSKREKKTEIKDDKKEEKVEQDTKKTGKKKEEEEEKKERVKQDKEIKSKSKDTEIKHEGKKIQNNNVFKGEYKRMNDDNTVSNVSRRRSVELKWGEVYPDFDIAYLPNVLPKYGIERLKEIGEEQERQIRILDAGITKALKVVRSLRSASDEWLSLEKSRVKDITDACQPPPQKRMK